MELGLHHRMFPKLHKRIYDCSSKKNFILNGIASYEFEGGGKVNVEHHEPNATAKAEGDNYPKKKGKDDTYDLWASCIQSKQLISDLHSLLRHSPLSSCVLKIISILHKKKEKEKWFAL